MAVQMHSLLLLPLWPVLLQAQPPAQPPGPATPSLPVSLERIRRELERRGTTITSDDSRSRPLFRVEVIDQFPRFEFQWIDQSSTPGYVRPPRGLVHHEFLEQVTPDLFRGTALYPCCDVLPLVRLAGRKISGVKASIDRARARKEVRESLAELLREREKQKQDQAVR